jgi:hypothetical protein
VWFGIFFSAIALQGNSIYMQKSVNPVMTDDYAINALGANEVITSDELFYAALVSFGSFGVIHGYLIEMEKLFQLSEKFSLLGRE